MDKKSKNRLINCLRCAGHGRIVPFQFTHLYCCPFNICECYSCRRVKEKIANINKNGVGKPFVNCPKNDVTNRAQPKLLESARQRPNTNDADKTPFCAFCKSHGLHRPDKGQHYKFCKFRSCPCKACTKLRVEKETEGVTSKYCIFCGFHKCVVRVFSAKEHEKSCAFRTCTCNLCKTERRKRGKRSESVSSSLATHNSSESLSVSTRMKVTTDSKEVSLETGNSQKRNSKGESYPLKATLATNRPVINRKESHPELNDASQETLSSGPSGSHTNSSSSPKLALSKSPDNSKLLPNCGFCTNHGFKFPLKKHHNSVCMFRLCRCDPCREERRRVKACIQASCASIETNESPVVSATKPYAIVAPVMSSSLREKRGQAPSFGSADKTRNTTGISKSYDTSHHNQPVTENFSKFHDERDLENVYTVDGKACAVVAPVMSPPPQEKSGSILSIVTTDETTQNVNNISNISKSSDSCRDISNSNSVLEKYSNLSDERFLRIAEHAEKISEKAVSETESSKVSTQHLDEENAFKDLNDNGTDGLKPTAAHTDLSETDCSSASGSACSAAVSSLAKENKEAEPSLSICSEKAKKLCLLDPYMPIKTTSPTILHLSENSEEPLGVSPKIPHEVAEAEVIQKDHNNEQQSSLTSLEVKDMNEREHSRNGDSASDIEAVTIKFNETTCTVSFSPATEESVRETPQVSANEVLTATVSNNSSVTQNLDGNIVCSASESCVTANKVTNDDMNANLLKLSTMVVAADIQDIASLTQNSLSASCTSGAVEGCNTLNEYVEARSESDVTTVISTDQEHVLSEEVTKSNDFDTCASVTHLIEMPLIRKEVGCVTSVTEQLPSIDSDAEISRLRGKEVSDMCVDLVADLATLGRNLQKVIPLKRNDYLEDVQALPISITSDKNENLNNISSEFPSSSEKSQTSKSCTENFSSHKRDSPTCIKEAAVRNSDKFLHKEDSTLSRKSRVTRLRSRSDSEPGDIESEDADTILGNQKSGEMSTEESQSKGTKPELKLMEDNVLQQLGDGKATTSNNTVSTRFDSGSGVIERERSKQTLENHHKREMKTEESQSEGSKPELETVEDNVMQHSGDAKATRSNSADSIQLLCEVCGKTCPTQSQLRMHGYLKHHIDCEASSDEIYRCHECLREFSSELSMDDHQSQDHMGLVPLHTLFSLFANITKIRRALSKNVS